jgi:hypothetical protein
MGVGSCLLFVRQLLAEKTPQSDPLRSLQRDPDARVSVADLSLAESLFRHKHCR